MLHAGCWGAVWRGYWDQVHLVVAGSKPARGFVLPVIKLGHAGSTYDGA